MARLIVRLNHKTDTDYLHRFAYALVCIAGERTGVAFSKIAYERGVVIARCSHCDVQHLISDQLGWFGERSNIEDILREKGQDIRRGGTDGVLALTPEDIASWSRTQSTQSKG